MTTTVRYIGTTSPYFETAVTGKPGKWFTGTTGDVSDSDAALLVATGLFEVHADRVLPFAFDAVGAIAGVRLPNMAVAPLGNSGSGAPAWASAFGTAQPQTDPVSSGALAAPTPGTPANEYLSAVGNYGTGTDGSNDWGSHQTKMVRMADGTLFAIYFDASNLLLARSATNGAYGSAWTTVATITNASRHTDDLDAHLLRNPITDQVHLICSASAGVYKVRTYNSDGTYVGEVTVPHIYPAGHPAVGWFGSNGTTKYSAAGIGSDGTIVLTASASGGDSVLGWTATEMDAAKRVQLMRWDGFQWVFSGIYTHRIGPRLAYDRIFVSPPGHAGSIVIVSTVDVKYNDWNIANNPNYVGGGAWPNTDANSTYFGGGRQPRVDCLKIQLSALGAFSRFVVVPYYPRTTDIPGSPGSGDYQAHSISGQLVAIDALGRFWVQTTKGVSGSTTERHLYVVSPTGTLLYDKTNAWGTTAGFMTLPHFDADGAIWSVWVNSGNSMNVKVLTITDTGSDIVVQDQAAATEQRATPLGMNNTTGNYQAINSAHLPDPRRSGSSPSDNFFDVLLQAAADHTGTTPGTTASAFTNGALRIKRVRVGLP